MVVIECPFCHSKMSVDPSWAGKIGKCNFCQDVFTISPALFEKPDEPDEPVDLGGGKLVDESGRWIGGSSGSIPTQRPEVEDEERPRPKRRSREEEREISRPQQRPRPRRRRSEVEDAERPRSRRSPSLDKEIPKPKTIDDFWITLCVLLGIGFVSALFAFAADWVVYVTLVFAALICLTAAFWTLGVASEEGALQVLLILSIPPYAVFYTISRFELLKRPFFLHLTGLGVAVLGLIMMAAVVDEGDSEKDSSAKQSAPDLWQPPRRNEWNDPRIENDWPGRPIRRDLDDFPQNEEPPRAPVENEDPEVNVWGDVPKLPAVPRGNRDLALQNPGSDERGLRAYWSFDEGRGAEARDSSRRLRAQLHNCQWARGVHGTALQFNGSSSVVDLGSDKTLSFAKRAPFTIVGWLKTTQEGKGILLSFRNSEDATTHDMIVVFVQRGNLVAWVRHRGYVHVPAPAISAKRINDGEWHHFAVIRDANGEVSLIVDGAQKTTRLKGIMGPATEQIVTDLRWLGQEPTDASLRARTAFYEGVLDELAIYGSELTEKQIRTLASR